MKFGLRNADRTRVRLGSWTLIPIFTTVFFASLKTLVALNTYGTNDVLTFEKFLISIQQLGGMKMYYQVLDFNHPPFVVHLLEIVYALADATRMPFSFCLRFLGIIADFASPLLLFGLLKPYIGHRSAALAAAAVAASPTSFLITGFHGNTDPILMFFLMLSIYLIDRKQNFFLAGLAFGMSINIKIVPLVFVPVILWTLKQNRHRLQFFLAVIFIISIGSYPFIFQDPVFIAKRVMGYSSISGYWGLSLLVKLVKFLPANLDWIPSVYAKLGKYFVLTTIIGISLWMKRSTKFPLYLRCSTIAFTFLSLAPGFGAQYLTWLVPWVVGIGPQGAIVFYATSALFLGLLYNQWCQSFPWYIALAHRWDYPVICAGLICWIVVVGVSLLYLIRLWRSREFIQDNWENTAKLWLIFIIASCLISGAFSTFLFFADSKFKNQIFIAADDSAKIYVSGRLAAQITNWDQAAVLSLSEERDQTLIAVEVTNQVGAGGIIGSIRQGTVRNIGQFKLFSVISADWRCHTVQQPGWRDYGFDDTAWKKPETIAAYGRPPWGRSVPGRAGIRGLPYELAVAPWAWTENPPQNNTIFCRWLLEH